MTPLTNAVTNLLTGREHFCRLCFNSVDEDAIRFQDEVVFRRDSAQQNEEIFNMLIHILGEEHTKTMYLSDSMCNDCLKEVKNSYKFVKMCRENTISLADSINSLNDCFENTTDDLNSFKSLFVSVDIKNFSIKQYYDNRRSVTNQTMALARFRSLAYGKYMKQDVKPIPCKRKQHNYGEEMNQICDIIRENNQVKFKCKVCAGLFNKSFNFKKHYYSQHCEKQFKCPDCDKSYGSDALLKQHRYDSHTSIICSECGKTYTNRYSLIYHMRRHSGEQPYECKHCGMKFLWSSRRAEHIRRFHLEPSVECNICHIKFRSLCSMYEHRKRHFNPNSRLYVMQQTPPVAEEEEV